MPPATEASNPSITPFLFASWNISSPSSARRALLAVTTCFLFLIALNMKSFAGLIPPISSTTISISGSSIISLAFVVRIPSGSLIPLSLFISRSAILAISISRPVLFLISSEF